MSYTLLFSNSVQTDKKPVSTLVDRQEQKERWLDQVVSTIGYGRQRKHDGQGCQQCDMVAYYYRQVLEESRYYEMDPCVLELVWQMTKMLLEHLEARLYHPLDWFGVMARDLWQYAKRLKEEGVEGELENAIRITIYHCRASIHQHGGTMDDLFKARIYYRKCMSLPTVFARQQSLQDAASSFLSQNPFSLSMSSSTLSISSSHSNSSSQSYSSHPPPLQSPSSISSSSTVSSFSSTPLVTNCGHCGLEKKAMPICAKCRSQRYCSARCLKEHRAIHVLTCQNT